MIVSKPLRSVTAAEVESFWQNGYVHLPKILSGSTLSWLGDALRSVFVPENQTKPFFSADPCPDDPSAGMAKSHFNTFHWDEAVFEFITQGPLAEISAQVLGTTHLRAFGDHAFLKEGPGAPGTTLHRDSHFFPVSGDQMAVCWLATGPVSCTQAPMVYVKKTHMEPSDDLIGLQPDATSPLPKDAQAIETSAGDVIVHHPRLIHGSLPYAHQDDSGEQRRALSVRYCGDDIRWQTQANPLSRLGALWHASKGQPNPHRLSQFIQNLFRLNRGRDVKLDQDPIETTRQQGFRECHLLMKNGESLDARECARQAFPLVLRR